MFSYWEQESFFQYDHIIIGSGITGLNTAISMKEHFPGERVLVLERGLMTTGASSRNAGFACMGSATEIIEDLQAMEEAEVLSLFQLRKTGLEKMAERLGADAIGYRKEGSYELVRAAELSVLERLDYLNELLYPILGTDAYRLCDHRIREFGFDKARVLHLIESTAEGSLHTGKMLRKLTDYAIDKKVEIKTGAQVSKFEEEPNGVRVFVEDPYRQGHWPLLCKTLCICTNAFTAALLPGMDVIPGRGQVLLTGPVPGLSFRGIFHFDHGYYYFRELNGRVLFGGGRNLDFQGETTNVLALNQHIQEHLEEQLREWILPGKDFQVAQRWAGIMAFGKNRMPVIRSFSNRIFGAFRMGGMGVAVGTEVGCRLAAMVGSNHNR